MLDSQDFVQWKVINGASQVVLAIKNAPAMQGM